MKFPSIGLWHFFTSIKNVSLSVISFIEYIYVHIEYIKNKSNTQNCQVENNTKMIFAMEKFKLLVVMLSKLSNMTTERPQAPALEAFLCQGRLE